MTFAGRTYDLAEDERNLLKAISVPEAGVRPDVNGYVPNVRVRDVYEGLGMPHKRMVYLTETKWGRNDWYDFGVSCDLGWLTPKGLELVKAIEMQEMT